MLPQQEWYEDMSLKGYKKQQQVIKIIATTTLS